MQLKIREGYKKEGEYSTEGQALTVKNELQIDGFLPRIFYNETTRKWEVWAKGRRNW